MRMFSIDQTSYSPVYKHKTETNITEKSLYHTFYGSIIMYNDNWVLSVKHWSILTFFNVNNSAKTF